MIENTWSDCEVVYQKFQITNNKQVPMTEIQNSKPVCHTNFGHWILEFEYYLKFGAWNLGFQ